MPFNAPTLKPPTPNSKTKFEKLCEQFNAAKSESPEAFERLIREVVTECKQTIARDYAVTIPNNEVVPCYSHRFDELYAQEPQHGAKPSAFIDGGKGIIVINIEEKLALGYWGAFTAELVLDVSEEFVHAVFPREDEIETKKKSHEITERFLEIKIPEDYKKAVLENAASPNY